MADELAKVLYEEHGVVLLKRFNQQYQPLVTLKVSKSHNPFKPVTLAVWDAQVLAGLKLSAATTPPAVGDISKTQTLSSYVQRKLDVSAGVKAVFSVGAHAGGSSSIKYDVEFYSRGVYIGPLTKCIKIAEPGDDWANLTIDSTSWCKKPTCGIIREVLYGKHVQVDSNVTIEAGADVQPGGPVPVGAELNADGSTEHRTVMDTADYQPFAFRYVLCSYSGGKWSVHDEPHKKAVAMGRLPDGVGAAGSSADGDGGISGDSDPFALYPEVE